jgi:hypothetical protein
MKQSKISFYLLLFVWSLVFLTGCSPSFQKMGWFIPVLFFAAALFFFYRAIILQKKTGYYLPSVNNKRKKEGQIKIYKLGQFWYSLVFLIAAVVVMIAMVSAK